MPLFAKSVEICAPVQVVFRFHEGEDALSKLSPSFPPIKLIYKAPGIRAGTRVKLRIGPLHWVAEHTAFVRNHLFVDKQIDGPFASWVHRHEFEDLGDRTRLTDRIEYRLPGGRIVDALLDRVVKFALGKTFTHRHAVTKRLCEGRRQAGTGDFRGR